MANSVQFLLLSKESSPSTWTIEKLDQILDDGDKLYCTLQGKNPYLSLDDIPLTIDGVGLSVVNTVQGSLFRKKRRNPFTV